MIERDRSLSLDALLLGGVLLLGAACSSASPSAQGGDASASPTCGACPASAPVCFHLNAHDGSHIVSAECVAMPDACNATPTCDCAKSAIAAARSADAGADSGVPLCIGQIYCDGSEGPLTVRCNPP